MRNIKGRMLRKLKKVSTPKHPPLVVVSRNDALTPLMPLEEDLANGDDAKKTLTSPKKSKETELTVDQPCPKIEKEKAAVAVAAEKCPPGGREAVVLYSTSLRGIRKTFEDCNAIRFLLGSFRVVYSERDVSMHMEYREELWGILGGRVVPPRLFVRGRYVGGAEEVVGLHERGALRTLLQGIPTLSPSSHPCRECAGQRFLLCAACNGSRRVLAGDGTSRLRCLVCNENGLVKCSLCS